MRAAAASVVARLIRQSTRVRSACGIAFRPRPRKNCGPTLYPVANRNRSKNTTLTIGSMRRPSWPTKTPASSVPTTLPRLKP